MSTGDFFNPPDLHHILGPTRQQARREPQHREPAGRRRWQKESRAKPAHKIRNPLYSRALDHGVNDGNQGKTQNSTSTLQTGHAFSGAYTFPDLGSGNP